MPDEPARSTATVALLIVGVLMLLWAIRFVLGVFVGLVRPALLGGLALAGVYAVYRLWHGWSPAKPPRERPPQP